MTTRARPPERSLHQLVRFAASGQFVQPFFTLGISVLVARVLGPEGRGGYGLAAATVALVPAVFMLGLEVAVRYWSARGRVDPGALLRTATLLGLGVGLVTGSLVFALWWLGSPDWLVPPDLALAGALGLCGALLFASLRGHWMNYLVGQERYGYMIWGTNAAMALQLAVLAGLAWAGRLTLDAALLSFALQFGASIALFPALAGRDLARAARAPLLPLREVTGMLRYGLWQYLSSLLLQLEMRGNVFLLAALGGMYETGLFTAVLGPANFFFLLALPINSVIGARTTRRKEDPDFAHRVATALRLVVVVTALPALAAAAVAPTLLVWVFGERFAAAVVPFWILLPGVVAFSLVRVTSGYLAGARRPEWNTYVAIVGASITLGLSALLIPSLGAAGAAVATTLAHGTAAVVSAIGFLRVSGLAARDLLTFRTSDWEPVGRVVGWRRLRKAIS